MSDLPQEGLHNNLDHGRLMALINSMSDAFLAVDSKLNITLSNSLALDLLDLNSLNGRQLVEVFKPFDKNAKQVELKKLIMESIGHISTTDWIITYDDGSQLNIQVNISPVRQRFGSQDSGYVILMRDITKEMSIQQEREEFISVVSHELRTPVAVAEGSISNAAMLAQKNGMSSDFIDTINTAHQRIIFLGSMINDLSTLSRAERGKLDMTIDEFSVDELLQSLLNDYRDEARKKGLDIRVANGQKVGMMSSSRLYVQEVLQNFVTNSLKYTERGSISISAVRKDNGVEFSVSDTGIGIAKSDQAKLFDKFYRSSDWRVKKVNGTGLGLYVTSKLVKLISGKLSIESELNKGSTFRIFVPESKKHK
jgi:two-component system phosphate regulon sensor histidine kinase PhoR